MTRRVFAILVVLTVGALSPSVDLEAQNGPAGFRQIPPDERKALARRTGPLAFRGRVHLSGVVFAEELVIEPDAEVTVEAGTVIYTTGDLVIRAPLRVVPAPEVRLSGPGKADISTGADGEDADDLNLVCDGENLVVAAPIQGLDGGDGKSVVATGWAIAGNGGWGSSIGLVCRKGTITISADISPGRGGSGGDCDVLGVDGKFGEKAGNGGNAPSANARAGNGGRSGRVRIEADTVVFEVDETGRPLGRVALRAGGRGGEASVKGGTGGDANPGKRGGRGGRVFASGGRAGTSTVCVVDGRRLLPEHLTASDISVDEGVLPNGGDAVASGGPGGRPLEFEPGSCPKRGRKGGSGGAGGKAIARGGGGASGARIGGGKGALRQRSPAEGESPPGAGGSAEARGGGGGFAARGEDGQRPGGGGRGGAGGDAEAYGGKGGSVIIKGLTLLGGRGGDARAFGGPGSDGGDGGDCCDATVRKGGKEGRAGWEGSATAVGGPGGTGGPDGPPGKGIPTVGLPGLNGGPGKGCHLVIVGKTMSVRNPGIIFSGEEFDLDFEIENHGPERFVDIEVRLGRQVIFSRKGVRLPAADESGPGTHSGSIPLTFDSKGKQKLTLWVDGEKVGTLKLKVKKGGPKPGPGTWVHVDSPTTSNLRDVWMWGSKFGVAVGDNVILHYDGASWKEVGGGALGGWRVSGDFWGNVYSVGNWTLRHFNEQSKAWTDKGVLPFLGQEATESGAGGYYYDVWVVPAGKGVYASCMESWIPSTGSRQQIQRWVDDSWSIMWTEGLPEPEHPASFPDIIRGIWGRTENDVYAVTGSGVVYHYDGNKATKTYDEKVFVGQWVRMEAQPDDASGARGLWGSGNNLYVAAVNSYHFDGTTWKKVISGNSGVRRMGVWGLSADRVFFAGYGDDWGKGHIFGYNGAEATPMIGPEKGLADLWAVHGADPDHVFAVGLFGKILQYRPGN